MLGPHFYFDLIRLARHRRNLYIRCGYLLLMLAGWFIADQIEPDVPRRINDYATVAMKFTWLILGFQYAMVFLLAPIYFAGTIAGEAESGTLELLFMTHLKDHEILLGKYAARVVHLVFVSLLGLPFLAIVSLWGGVNVQMIATHFCMIAALIVLVSSACQLSSALADSHAMGLVLSYFASFALLYFGGYFCCFILMIAAASTEFTLIALVIVMTGAAGGSAILLLFANLRLRTLRHPNEQVIRTKRKRVVRQKPIKPKIEPRVSAARPVPDNALLWKELIDGEGTRQLAGVGAIAVLVGFVLAGGTSVLSKISWLGPGEQRFFAALSYFFFASGYAFSLAGVILLLALRLTAVIAREREQGTLRFLLLLPVERSEILWTKFIAPWIVTRYLIATLIIAPIVALVTGIYSLRTCGVLLLLPWPSVIFAAGLALYLSVRCRRWLTANVVFMVIVAVVGFVHLLGGETSRFLLDGFWLALTGDSGRRGGLSTENPMSAVGTFLMHQATFAGIGVLLWWRAFARFGGWRHRW